MCGIAGFAQLPGARLDLQPLLVRAVELQHHRGPDAQGIWQSPARDVGLAHNRLSILDLSAAGHQPLHSADGKLTIVFNGEIYNWQALRGELEGRGVTFRTSTDTEVLLEAYRAYGLDVLPRLRGMFAFGLYDHRDGSLLCARDRIGKKPFVYAQTDKGFAFASEIPAVLAMPGCDTRLNHGALAAMLLHNIRHIPDPHTAFRGIKRLRPGHAMVIREGRIDRTWRYWDPLADATAPTPARLREVLEGAVATRMVADVPVGALLSGGVDSSAVVNLMTRIAREPVRTYALGLDPDDEDLRRARTMAKALGCIHREYYFDAARQLDVLCQIISTYGEPIMLLPLVHTYELCKAIRDDGVKVVLAGHGADELFYGYTGHLRTALLSSLLPWAAPLIPLARLLPRSLACKPLMIMAARSGQRKAALYRAVEEQAWGCLDPAIRRDVANVAAEEFAYWGSLLPRVPYIDESNFLSLMVENTHSVTIAGDLPAMLASVEMRAPFLDQHLVSLALATPYRKKVPSFRDASRLKQILKTAVADLVPADLLYAPKRGFGYGIPERMVLKGPWRGLAEEAFATPDDVDGLFRKDALQGLWRRHERGEVRSDLVAKHLAIQLWRQMARPSSAPGRRFGGTVAGMRPGA